MAKDEPNFEDDRPWTEAQWEAFMKHADLRSAMYQERLETEFNKRQNDDDKIDYASIAQDMGWKDDRASNEEDAEENDAIDRPWLKYAFTVSEEDEAEFEQSERESTSALQKILPYRRSLRTSRQVRQWLKSQIDRPSDEDDDVSRLFGTLMVGPDICGAKIAGGHGMGYEPDMIGGNIVNNRRGRDALLESREALAELVSMKIVPPDLATKIDAELNVLIGQMDARIAALRAMITW